MAQLESEIRKLSPILRVGVSSFNTVDERTQGSINMQKELEFASELYTTRKRLSSTIITENIHDQKYTNLCVSISVVSALRSAQRTYLVSKGNSKTIIMSEQDDIKGQFSFDKCLVLFTGCVSPRSLEAEFIII